MALPTHSVPGDSATATMRRPVWYRSLYWRIAFGFIALLAVLLLVQGLVVLWLTDRLVGASPARTPRELAQYVAADVGAAIEKDPQLALEPFVQQRFGRIYQPFLVGLADGRRASNKPRGLPPNLERLLAGRLRGGNRPGLPDDPDRPFGRGPGPGAAVAPIIVNGRQTGLVAVPMSPPPFSMVVNELGPTLTLVGLVLLAAGATVTALLIFRPAHKRLRALEQAARALGEGRDDVRAVEGSNDEVGSLARTFNQMAEDLSKRTKALTEADRARRQLLADVSHELMTPLTAIRGYTETLAMPDVQLAPGARERYLGIVEQETHKLEAIIGDLLDLARLEGGGETLMLEAVPIDHLFGRVADRHEPVIRDRQIRLITSIAPGSPAVHGDAGRLEQAVQNLAANAIRHTPPGGTVTLSATPHADGVRISVADTGPGIPPEHLPRLFDRFYKVDAARAGTAVPSGSGLGLSIVRAIVERHGGRVTAGNANDGGAVFELVLPAAAPAPTGRIDRE